MNFQIYLFQKREFVNKKKIANDIEKLIEAYKKDLQPALKLVTKDKLTNFKDAS